MQEPAGGQLYFGLAESYQMRYLAADIRRFKARWPGFRFHTLSGDTEPILEKLDKGILDFGVICTLPDTEKYDFLTFPKKEVWGAVMRSDDPLAQKEALTAADLEGRTFFASEQAWTHDFPAWAGSAYGRLRLEGSFSLSYNGSIFAREGLGILLTFDHLIATGPGTGLVFRPLAPRLETTLYFIWRKGGPAGPLAAAFLDLVREGRG
jgi:DNA-binding transcriptional LysR family regulator